MVISMKEHMRRIALILLAILLVASMYACEPDPESVSEPETSVPTEIHLLTEGDFDFAVRDGEAQITDYFGSEQNVAVPDTLGGVPVTEIGANAFHDNDTLRSVTLPDSVRTIGDNAFSYCYALETVRFGSGLKRIDDYAFCGCSAMHTVELPDGVAEIGKGAFSETRLTDVGIPGSVRRIEANAFANTLYLASLTDEFVIVGDGVLLRYNGAERASFCRRACGSYPTRSTGSNTMMNLRRRCGASCFPRA